MSRKSLIAVFMGVILCVAGVALAWDSAGSGYRRFQVNKTLDSAKSGMGIRIADLKVLAGRKTLVGRTKTRVRFDAKNLTSKTVEVSIHFALFDGQKELLAAGNFTSASPEERLGPQDTRSITVDLGHVENIDDVKYYQYRLVSFEEEKK